MLDNMLFYGKPRDIKRIKPMLEEIEKVWELYPDLRLGQLLVMCAGKTDLFSIEDDNLLVKIKECGTKK